MPTAEHFTALGAGNGFPSCIIKVDMTQPTDSATWAAPNINELTFDQLMNLYWNLYGITGTATAIGTSETITQSDLNIPDSILPDKRACSVYHGDFREVAGGAPDYPTTIQSVGVKADLVAMYNGVTTNEANFIGYAMGDSQLPHVLATCQAGTSGIVETMLFAGYAPNASDDDAWAELSAVWSGTPPTITDVTYQGLPLIKAELELGSTTSTATITDITLYTYP